jgi:hypothetical protein
MLIYSDPTGLRRPIQISSSIVLLSVSSQTVKWLMRNWSAGLVTSSQKCPPSAFRGPPCLSRDEKDSETPSAHVRT